MDSQPSLSKLATDSSLLYSEYMNTNSARHVVSLIENKNKQKPDMKFVPSSILSRVQELLPRLEEGEKELKKKPKKDCDIEILEPNSSVVEIDVAVIEESENSEVLEVSDSESTESADDVHDTDILEVLSETILHPNQRAIFNEGCIEDDTDLMDRPTTEANRNCCAIEHFPHNTLEIEMSAKERDKPPSNILCQVLE